MKMNSEQFSLRCASSFACFLPALSLVACTDFHTAPSSAAALVWLSNEAARFVFSALRISHPVATREERRGVPSPSPWTAATHTRARVNIYTYTHTLTHSLRFFLPWKRTLRTKLHRLSAVFDAVDIHHRSAGFTQTRPAVPSSRPDGKSSCVCVCVGGGSFSLYNHVTSVFSLVLWRLSTRWPLLHSLCIHIRTQATGLAVNSWSAAEHGRGTETEEGIMIKWWRSFHGAAGSGRMDDADGGGSRAADLLRSIKKMKRMRGEVEEDEDDGGGEVGVASFQWGGLNWFMASLISYLGPLSLFLSSCCNGRLGAEFKLSYKQKPPGYFVRSL